MLARMLEQRHILDREPARSCVPEARDLLDQLVLAPRITHWMAEGNRCETRKPQPIERRVADTEHHRRVVAAAQPDRRWARDRAAFNDRTREKIAQFLARGVERLRRRTLIDLESPVLRNARRCGSVANER